MKSLIQWSVRNAPAMNTLMVAVLIVGLIAMLSMRREVFPEFELEVILVTVPYPGASPEEVEDGICQKIEEAVRPISGIKKQTTVAREGLGFLVLELEADTPDVQKILNEVRSEIDRIPSMPVLAEDPEVKQITMRQAAIRVGVVGPDSDDPESELKLRAVAERIRDDVLQLPSVSQATLLGARDYQIDIEIPEDTLRKHNLSLQQVAGIVRRENIELPGGSMKTDSQEVLIRGKNKQTLGEDIAKIPLVTLPNGLVLTVGDLGTVRDEFADTTSFNRVDGRPAMVVSVDRTSSEDLFAIVDEVKQYLKEAAESLPAGYDLRIWQDRSVDVRDRMELLSRNGLQGLLLVFLVLAVFLELKLAFWVALGIPISVLGASAILLYSGHTLNMLSMFAFLMALGIVVDDAIVIGENIYAHRQRGAPFVTAAVHGTIEVLPSVFASVTTTIIAFMPLAYVAGIMGKFIAVLPVAVIAMLVISLIESTFILPTHLAHRRSLLFVAIEQILYPLRPLARLFAWVNVRSDRFLTWLIGRCYTPSLRWSLGNPMIVLSSAAALLLLTVGLEKAGITPWVLFPKLDSNTIQATVTYPDGTPGSTVDEATQSLEQAMLRVNEKYAAEGMPVIRLRHRMVGLVGSDGVPGRGIESSGSHMGTVSVELVPTSERNVTSHQLINAWRAEAGQFPGVEELSFRSPSMGPGGPPIEFKLLTSRDRLDDLEAAVEKCKARLREYPGVFDVSDDSRPGKWEYQLKIKEKAVAMGVPLADLSETVRASYYGDEVMRLQRGRHEVKLMVRYPREERRSLANFEEIRVRTGDGAERPLTELADVEVHRGYSEINRVDQMRSITITADVDEGSGNASDIVANLQASVIPEVKKQFPGIRVRWEGQQEQTAESVNSLLIGFLIALFAMFVLLTLEFRSYLQPLLILLIIPFGVIGAIVGHALLQLPLTLFSLFGLVALTGVVVNDSIVLIDFINKRLADGDGLKQALLLAGRRRFRPVLLTSATTIAGLLPILTERSFQAQILIPMATSLAFGLMMATVLVLYLVPTLYFVYARITSRWEQLLFGRSETARVGEGSHATEDESAETEESVESLAF